MVPHVGTTWGYMAAATTGSKVRIFELAKEVGLTSKELIALFNERLGGVFEAKNQLSVVPDNIADLVRSVLIVKGTPAPKAPGKESGSAAPRKAAAPKVTAPTAAPPPPAEAPPVPRLRPVPASSAPRSQKQPAAKTPAVPPAQSAPEAIAPPSAPAAPRLVEAAAQQ